jgi:hypothetical protein
LWFLILSRIVCGASRAIVENHRYYFTTKTRQMLSALRPGRYDEKREHTESRPSMVLAINLKCNLLRCTTEQILKATDACRLSADNLLIYCDIRNARYFSNICTIIEK